MKLSHVGLIASYSARFVIRSGSGVVFTLIALLFGLMVAYLLIWPVESTVAQFSRDGADNDVIAKQTLERLVEVARDPVEWFLGSDEVEEIGDESSNAEVEARQALDTWSEHILDDNPAILSALFIILLAGWPFIVCFGGFDIYSSEIASRGLRYQLLRTDRGSIFFGRFLGAVAMTAVTVGLLLGSVVLYVGIKLKSAYDWPDLATWGAVGLLGLTMISLPYLALCAWVSATITSPFGSLVTSTAIIGGVPLVAALGSSVHDSLGNLSFALPWGFHKHLLHYDALNVLGAVFGCLAFTALFLFLGYRQFRTRDL